jgi:flagellar hook protein FlgE
MGAISDNISNVNTVGYKNTTVNFQTLVTKQVSLTEYSPGGVQSKPRANVDVQGLLQSTSSSTDVALSGQGMFVVNTNADPSATASGMFAYTRAGSFKVNQQGFLQNSSGFFIQGWPLTPTDSSTAAAPTNLDVNGNTYMKAYKNSDGTTHYCNQNIINPNELKGLNLNTIGGTADQTTQIKIGANLPSGDSVFNPATMNSSGLHQTSVLIYDSLGNTSNFNVNWMKTNSNTWNIGTNTDPYSSLYGSMLTTTAATELPAANGPAGTSPVTISVNGIARSNTSGFTTAIGGNTIDFNAPGTPADALDYPVGTIMTLSPNSDANAGTYRVTANAGGILTVASSKFLTQRGINPPTGAATMSIYNTANSGNLVYASQGRLDFTASNNADVSAYLGKNFTVNYGGNATTVTYQFYDSSNATPALAADPTAGAIVGINLSGAMAGSDKGALIATAIAKRISDPLTVANAGGITAGADLPIVDTNGSTVNIIQTLTGQSMAFNMSPNTTPATLVNNLANTQCTQVQARQWNAGPPPTDTVSGAFTVQAISETGDAMVFNGDGTPQKINVTKMDAVWADGAQSMTQVNSDIDKRMSLFLGNTSRSDGMTQLGGSYQLAYLTQNGAKFGNFTGVSIGSDGVVTALFDNGVRTPVFQIPVATFTNTDGLESLTGNTFIETNVSGSYTLRSAGQAGAATVNSGSLESSTVDIGTEFTTMIITQRAYSAAAKIITTADQMLDELVQIKR